MSQICLNDILVLVCYVLMKQRGTCDFFVTY